jgi:hypothetical protein
MDPRRASALEAAPFARGTKYATRTTTRAEVWPREQPQRAETGVVVVGYPSLTRELHVRVVRDISSTGAHYHGRLQACTCCHERVSVRDVQCRGWARITAKFAQREEMLGRFGKRSNMARRRLLPCSRFYKAPLGPAATQIKLRHAVTGKPKSPHLPTCLNIHRDLNKHDPSAWCPLVVLGSLSPKPVYHV